MENIRICSYLQGEENEILELIRNGFDEFVSIDCNKEGLLLFHNFIDPEEFRKRNQSETFTLTAKTEVGLIVGMIEVRNDGHICLLYRYGICYSPINCTITATLSALYHSCID